MNFEAQTKNYFSFLRRDGMAWHGRRSTKKLKFSSHVFIQETQELKRIVYKLIQTFLNMNFKDLTFINLKIFTKTDFFL